MEKGNSKMALIIGVIIVVIIAGIAIFVVFKDDNKNEIDSNNNDKNSGSIEQNNVESNQEVDLGLPEPEDENQLGPNPGTQLVEQGV